MFGIGSRWMQDDMRMIDSLFPDDPFFNPPPSEQQQQQQQQASSGQNAAAAAAGRPKEQHVEQKYPETAGGASQKGSRIQEQPVNVQRSHERRDEQQIAPRRERSGPQDFWASPFGLLDDFDQSFRRMDRMMDNVFSAARDQAAPRQGSDPNSQNYSYSSSSYSTSHGKDGKPFYRHATTETSSIGGVTESRARYADSLGNERSNQSRALGSQLREVIHERNYRGEERSRENLKEIEPDKVAEFEKAWESAREKADPQKQLLGRAGHSGALKSGQEESQKALPASKTEAPPAKNEQRAAASGRERRAQATNSA